MHSNLEDNNTMGDATIDPKVIQDMCKEIERLAKISEEKDAKIKILQKSA